MSAPFVPLLDRLVLREIAIPLGVGLLAILQLLVILQLLQLNEVVFGSAVSLEDLARVTAALAPHFLVTAVPLALMLGIQLGMGRLAADHELLALTAAGTHPLRLYRVPAAVGAVFALLVGALAHWAEPWGFRQLNGVLNDVIKRNLQTGLEPGVFNDGLPRFMIYVAAEERAPESAYATWRGVLIEDDVGDGAPLLALAEVGRIEDAGGEALALRLSRGELHRMESDGETVARFSEGTFLVGVQGPVSQKNRFSANEAALTGAELRRRAKELRQSAPREAARLSLERVRRWAMALACFAFALLSVPLALVARGSRGGAYLMTVGVFVAFYALSRVSTAFAASGMNPWLAGFIPDLCIFALVASQTRQLLRNGIGKPA
jgi:lipopolysaccharide export LptBFGC system permease protein LptF